MKPQMKWLKNEKGLTLIELLAVIVVLGIIAAIAVPAIQGTIEKQRINADEKSAEIIEAAALRYFYDHYPEGKKSDGTAAPTSVTIDDMETGGYLSQDFDEDMQSKNHTFDSVTASYDDAQGWGGLQVQANTGSDTVPFPGT